MPTWVDARPVRAYLDPQGRIELYTFIGCLVLCALGIVGPSTSVGTATRAEDAPCDSTWVWHYARGETPLGLDVYRQLMRDMPPGVRGCVVACGFNEAAARRSLSGSIKEGSEVDLVTVSADLSEWSRDRYVFFERDGRPHVLVSPRDKTHPEARGDLEVPAAIRALHPDLVIREVDFFLEGGDVVVLGTRVLIGVTSILRNTGPGGMGTAAFLAAVADAFGCEVLVVGQTAREVPYEHIDMFLTALDDDTVALGDPRLALDVFGGDTRHRVSLGDLGVFDRRHQEAIARDYDAIASELRGFGLEVLRLPVLHGEPRSMHDRGVVLNWNNVLLAGCGERRFAFVPRYGVASMDRRAQDLWAGWGYEVVPVDARGLIAKGGSLRCVTNVLPGHGRAHGRRRSPL